MYRRFKDVDINMDQKECSRLMELLTREGIPARKTWAGTLTFQWKHIHYDVIFFNRMAGKCMFEYKTHGISLEVRENALADERFCKQIFDQFHVRILNPTIVFIFITIARRASHYKKKDLFYLKKYASPAMAREIMEANPRHRNDFCFGSFDYAFMDWLKDELFCIFPVENASSP